MITNRQKTVLGITVGLIILSFIFPYWTTESRTHWVYFYPIFSPPENVTLIDYKNTCIQAIAILVVGVTSTIFIEKVFDRFSQIKIKMKNKVVLLGLLLILLSYLFPCWDYKRDGNIIQSKQFHFIFNPPYYERTSFYDFTEIKHQMTINYKQLQYQIAVIALITIGLVYMVRDK